MSTTTVTTRAVKGSALTHTEMDTNWTNLLGATIYVGTIIIWAAETVPDSKWLHCRGTALAAASYPDLFATLGYTYGGGGGTFYLPDYRGFFLRGTSVGSGRDPDAASRNARPDGTTGDNVGTWQGNQNLYHNHDNGGYNHLITPAPSDTSPELGWGFANGIGAAPIAASGGNEARPININVNFIIKALK